VKSLRESGFTTDHAADGESGLSLALSAPYDVAIVDLMLPKLDGLSLTAELRQEKPAIPTGVKRADPRREMVLASVSPRLSCLFMEVR
jgi:DNA-binding response OmpR family regulator